MNFSIDLEELKTALKRVKAIIPLKTPIIPLQNVLLEASLDKKEIRFTGFDSTISVSSTHPLLNIDESFKYTIPSKILCGITDSFQSGEVSFEITKDNKVKIKNNSYICNVIGLDAKEYPALPTIDEVVFYPVNSQDMYDILTTTFHAVSSDESRAVFTSVCMEMKQDGTIIGATTDGHRLAYSERKSESNKFHLDKQILFPKKAISSLTQLLENEITEEAQFAFSNDCIIVKKKDISMIFRLVQGEFPDFSSLLPDQNSSFITVPTKQLTDNIKFVLNFSTKTNQIILTLSKGRIDLSSKNDVSNGNISLDTDYDGDIINIGFNASYFLDALKTIESEHCRLYLSACDLPCVIKPEAESSSDYFVIMPMRIQ